MSGRMVAAHLNNCLAASGGSAVQMESWDLGVLTTSDFGEASVVDECWPTIKKGLDKMPNGQVAVITGFIGKDDEGRITTLGRGGSDLTASLLGAARASSSHAHCRPPAVPQTDSSRDHA